MWPVHVSDNPVWCGNPKTVRYDVFIVLVFAKLLFLLIKPYGETGIAFLKSIDIEVVYQHIGQYGSE